MCMRNESYKVVHDMLGEAIYSCDNDECLSAHAHSMLQAMQGVPTLLALECWCTCLTHLSQHCGIHVISAEKVTALVSCNQAARRQASWHCLDFHQMNFIVQLLYCSLHQAQVGTLWWVVHRVETVCVRMSNLGNGNIQACI